MTQLIAKFIGTPIGPSLNYASQVVRELQERNADGTNLSPESVECPLCLGTDMRHVEASKALWG